MKHFYLCFLFGASVLRAGGPSVTFKENKGQWPEKVLFGSEIFNTRFYINRNSFNYCIYNGSEIARAHQAHKVASRAVVHGHNYEVVFTGGDLTHFEKKDAQPEYYNYFLGNDRTRWASYVKAYKALGFVDVYKGIDLRVYGNGLNLEYDLVVAPQADLSQVKLSYNFTDGIELKKGELIIKTSVGEIVEKAPVAWQLIGGKRVGVKCEYILLSNNTVGFSLPDGYDKSHELVIDPVIVVCSYSGATTYAYASSCTYDALGNIYLSGNVHAGYPVTTGAFQLSIASTDDVVISCFNSTGTTKLFSTYLGGDSTDWAYDMGVYKNELVVYGMTMSKTYPCSVGAFDSTYNGKTDLVVSKLSVNGASLIASTYVGGSDDDPDNIFVQSPDWDPQGEMACDSTGNVYMISCTKSTDFPTTPGVISNTKKGGTDACVFKLNPGLTALVWSTYLGGATYESGSSLKLDGAGGLYCFGITNSNNFPTTSGTYGSSKVGPNLTSDMYISHINATGTGLIASTYIGTSSTQEWAHFLDLDPQGNVYVCGGLGTPSALVPSPGVYSNSNGYNFIFKLNKTLSTLVFKTKYGNNVTGKSYNTYLNTTAFRVDSCQNIYIAGMASNCLPSTPNSFQNYGGGYTDMYMALFNSNCSSLSFASFFGGPKAPPSHYGLVGEQSFGVSHFDNRGFLYMAISSNGALPVTSNAYCPTYSNTTADSSVYVDAFLKVDFRTFINASSSYGANLTVCPPFTANFTSATNTGTLSWDFGDGSPQSSQNPVTHDYSNLGNYNVLLVVTDTSTCNKTDSIKTKLSVIPPTTFDLGPDKFICINDTMTIHSNVQALSYLWNTGATTPDLTVNHPGSYTLSIFNGGCTTYDDVNVVIGEDALKDVFPNVITPNNDGVNDFIDLGKYRFSNMEFTVYDRWGRERYQTRLADSKWGPLGLDDGTYFYVISYQSDCTGETKKDKGTITIFR